MADGLGVHIYKITGALTEPTKLGTSIDLAHTLSIGIGNRGTTVNLDIRALSNGLHSTLTYDGRIFEYELERDAKASVMIRHRRGFEMKNLNRGGGTHLMEGDRIYVTDPNSRILSGYMLAPFIDTDYRGR